MPVRLAPVGLAMIVLVGLMVVPPRALAQEPPSFLPPGTEAPDIQVVGATRYGVLAEPVRLSQFRGKTVVLAFFFRARTPG